MYDIRLEGDTRAMLRRIRSFAEIDKKRINAALAEGVRESTLERFKQSRDPDGRRWKTSIRAGPSGPAERKLCGFRWVGSGSPKSRSALLFPPAPSWACRMRICRS